MMGRFVQVIGGAGSNFRVHWKNCAWGNLSWQSRMYNDIPLANGSEYRLEQDSYAITDLISQESSSDYSPLVVR